MNPVPCTVTRVPPTLGPPSGLSVLTESPTGLSRL